MVLPNIMHTMHLVLIVVRLAKYHADGQCQPPPIELEGDLEYDVKRILNKRAHETGRRSHIEYVIHWQCYDHTMALGNQ